MTSFSPAPHSINLEQLIIPFKSFMKVTMILRKQKKVLKKEDLKKVLHDYASLSDADLFAFTGLWRHEFDTIIEAIGVNHFLFK